MSESYLDTAALSRLAGLNALRHPTWAPEHTDDAATDVPSGTSAGDPTGDATAALIAVDLGVDGLRGMWIYPTSPVVVTGTYSLTIDGETYSYAATAGQTVAEVLEELRIDIVMAVIHSVTPVDTDGDGEANQLYLQRLTGVPIGAASGLSNMTAVRDATTATVRIWGLAVGSTRWRRIGERDIEDIELSYLDTWVCAPLQRLYVQTVSTDGRLRWAIAPCSVAAAEAVAQTESP